MLLLEHLERDIDPHSPEMSVLAHATVGEHFNLYEEKEEGKELDEEALKLNARVGTHLTLLPFTTNQSEDRGGSRKMVSMHLICTASPLN